MMTTALRTMAVLGHALGCCSLLGIGELQLSPIPPAAISVETAIDATAIERLVATDAHGDRLSIRRDAGLGCFVADSSHDGFTALFEPSGVELRATEGGWWLHVSSVAWGRKGAMTALAPAAPVASGRRVLYTRTGLTEWHVNDESGLEQGFTLTGPPLGRPDRTVDLELVLTSSLRINAKSQDAVELHDLRGNAVIVYSGLIAWDATGRPLRASRSVRHMGSGSARIVLSVDDRGAIYPLLLDPTWQQPKRVTGEDGRGSDQIGSGVALEADYVVVGARTHLHFFRDGAAYLYGRSTGGTNNWGQLRELLPSDTLPLGRSVQFGCSVSASGDTVVIGAYSGAEDIAINAGAAYVYERNAGGADNWGEVKRLTAADADEQDLLGWSVSISGDTIVAGAPGDQTPVGRSGAAQIFQRNAGGPDNWGQVEKLVASDGGAGDFFGESVSIDGNTVVIGARQAGDAGTESGAAYIFSRDEGGPENWGRVRKLIASDADASDWFGHSVSVAGETIAVGAVNDEDAGLQAGSVYVFDRNEGGADNWGEVQKLVARDAAPGGEFGYSLCASKDLLVVGARGRYRVPDADVGKVHVFTRRGSRWIQLADLVPGGLAMGDRFGESVSISRGTVAVGAPTREIETGPGGHEGAAYIFDPDYWLMRNDEISSLRPVRPDVASVLAEGLQVLGADGVPNEGEGGDESIPGSADDDDAYVGGPVSGLLDPDPTAGNDPNRPLIFYQLCEPGESLRIVREASGRIQVSF